jgi:hypothetical protein
MAIITVRSSTGFPYAFNIAGSTPTPEEQIRIDTFLAEKNAGLAALAAEQTPAEGDKKEAGFLDTIGLGGTQIKGAFGTVLEETGKLVGSDDMRRYGRSVQGQARDDMYEKLINMPELKEYDDIKGIGDAFTFAKQQAGMQAANLGISLTGTIGGTIAGGAAGTAVPIVGNVAGAIAGGIAGGALASAPLLYASNINRQKSEYAKGNIDKIDQWGALRATVGQAAMEGLADRFLIGKFIGPSQFKNIFVRGTVGLGTGAALEGLTEAGQQLIERYQAGLDISSDEAIEEYLSSAAAGAVLGGGIGGLGGVLSKSSAKIKQEQLERDLIASENDFKARVEKANKPTLQLPAPETTLSLPTPTRLALPAPSPDARYNQTEMDAVTAALEDGKKLTIPSIQKILRGLRKDKVPLQDARDILSELERRGAVEGNAKAPTTVDGKGEFVAPAGAGRPVNYYPERSIRKEIDALKTEVEKDTDSLIKLNVEQRTAEQTGFGLDGKKKNANTVLAEIAKTQEGIATKQQRIVDATEQLAKAKEIYDTPTSDYVPIEAGRKLGELADAPIEVIADRLEAQKNDLANSANTLNRAKRRSTSLKKKKKLTDVEQAELDNLSGVIGRLATKVASLAEVSTKTPEQIKQQAQFERNRQNAQADEQQTILDNKARAAQARAILEQASATQAPTFSYNQKQRDVLSKLRQRLSNLGIKDIKLQAVAGTKIDGNGNLVAESEGSFSAMNKLITLSMSMYDPNLTPQQLFNSLSEVMNHEVIHALSEAGVLTNSELKILARSVRGTKYTTMVDGKLTKRMYSYFDRAERLYPTYSTDKAKDGLPSMLEEEAIAEMFRDYLAGRLTKKEIPSSIFQKMKNFFMALMKSHAESGFDSVDKIFEGIRRGEIGARERQISPREQITDQSGDQQIQDADRLSSIYSAKKIFPGHYSYRGYIIDAVYSDTSNKVTHWNIKPENGTYEDAANSLGDAKFMVDQIVSQGTKLSAIPQLQKDDSNARTTGRSEQGRNGRGRNIIGAETALDGSPKIYGATGPDVRLVNIAEAYAAENGIDFKRQAEYVTIDPEFSQRISDAYDVMENDPTNPDVLRAYNELIDQTTAQYKALEDAGYSFYFFDDTTDPYDGNPTNAMRDLRKNKRMGVYSTAAGYGPDDDFNILDNPMLRDTGMKWPFGSPNGPKETVYANDLFRAVHDAFGHGLEGSGFRGRGEENAWQAHVRLFTGDAVKALTSETRGQNSWLNYGPYGKENSTAKLKDTAFAKQKVGLMPSFTWEERRSPDMPTEGSRELLSAIPQFLPKIPLAPQGVTAHRLPNILLTNGNGEAPLYPITQSFTFENEERNNQLTTDARRANPKPLSSIGAWKDLMQEAFGGDYIPTPPLIAMKYANSVDEVVNKIRKLTPDLKDGVDRGFEYVKEIRRMYETGEALPQMTMQLFIWGILSRGAGPMAQEAAYIDIINDAMPFVEKALREPLTLLDVNNWTAQIAGRMPTIKKEVNGKIVNVPDPDYTGEITGSVFANSPAKTVTMNINAAGRLVSAMSQFVGNSNRTVIDMIHEDMMDQNVSASDIRRTFLSKTKGAGIDNKVLSFILLVSGRDDVLVMDRIQGRHMWDDGRYGGANIYDGIGTDKAGLNGIFTGPPGLMITEAMEDAIRPNVREAYRILGRPDDGTLGRFHWETWVIDGEQVVDHSTLGAIINNSPIGFSVTEGKTDVYASQGRYIRTKGGSVMEYPTPNGPVYMTPTRFKEFTLAISKDANRKKSKTGIFKTDLTNGNFLVTARADIPWFNRPEINRDALYLLAEEFENADSNGEIFESNAGLGKNEKSVPTRISRNPRERNAEQRAAVSGREGSKYGTVIPQRGEGANEAAMAAFDEQLSAIYVSSNSGAQTPNVGPRDLMRHFEDLRYTGVTDFISSTLKNVGVKVFRVNPETEKKIESNTIGFISKLQDDMLPVGIMYDKLRKAYGSIPQAYDAYFKEQLYHGIIEPLVMKFRNDVSTPLIKRIATLKLTPAQTQALANISPYYRKVMGENRYNSYAAANAFLYASHAKERNRRIKQLSRSKDVKGSGMPDTEADAILAWVRGLSPQQRADFDFIKLSARNIVKQTNDVYIKGDLIPDYLSQDVTLPDGTVEAFTEYSDYVPLTGFADADQEAVDTRGGGGGKAAFGALSNQTVPLLAVNHMLVTYWLTYSTNMKLQFQRQKEIKLV